MKRVGVDDEHIGPQALDDLSMDERESALGTPYEERCVLRERREDVGGVLLRKRRRAVIRHDGVRDESWCDQSGGQCQS